MTPEDATFVRRYNRSRMGTYTKPKCDDRHLGCGCVWDAEFDKAPGRHVEPLWLVMVVPAVFCVVLLCVLLFCKKLG
jgi:hypothetical protein